MHLIAKKVAEKNQIKWLADFRDPWSNLYYNNEFRQLAFARNENKKLEKSVLQSADLVLTVSNHLKAQFEKSAKKVEVITNGFDDEILNEQTVELDKKFTISYIGLLPKQSNPKVLFGVLEEICKGNSSFKNDLKLNFIGDISTDVIEEINKHQLQENSNSVGYVSHKEAVTYQKRSQVLLLLIPNVPDNKGIVTGKVFEYLTAKRPILAIGNESGDLADILQHTNSGSVIGFDNHQKLRTRILEMYEKYQQQNLQVSPKNIDQYHRKNLTKQLADLLKRM